MKITLLTKEQSQELWENEKLERSQWTTEQIIEDAKFGLSLPGTKYILTNQYESFFEWLTTSEARQEWNNNPSTLHLAKYYNERTI